MAFPLDRDHVQKLTEELETVIAAHLAWFKRLNKVLLYGEGEGGDEFAEDAHLRTAFGRWYYLPDNHPLAEQPVFHELGPLQREMHAVAQVLVRRPGRDLPPAERYDRCIDLALRLNARLRHLQLEVIGELLATDTLTGCFSRRGMIARLQGEQERAQRIQRPCSICLMDFDRFKRINDELGHPAGDAVLRQGMRFAMGILRKYDSVFRYGGEEFLLCLPGTPLDDAVQVVERLRAGLEKLPIHLPSGDTHHVTASFGLAELPADRPVEDAIARADQALIQAKEQGRNRLQVAGEPEASGKGDLNHV